MSNLATLTQQQIRYFAEEWFDKLDNHVPPKDYIPMLAREGLEMQFPEGNFVGFDGFKRWYENAINSFFDEVHTIKEIEMISASPEKLKLKVVVNWKASTWNSPEPKSRRISMDAYQSWIIKTASTTKKPVIKTYEVDDIKYAEGSAQL